MELNVYSSQQAIQDESRLPYDRPQGRWGSEHEVRDIGPLNYESMKAPEKESEDASVKYVKKSGMVAVADTVMLRRETFSA